MKNLKLILVLAALSIILFSLFLVFKTDDVKVENVSGFEAEELKIQQKYGDKKVFSHEELVAMDKEVNDLIDKKIKALKERKQSSSQVSE